MNSILFCITGPSGSGKTTIMKEIMENEVGSFTTRPMRDGEVQGREYNFISKDEFFSMRVKGKLAEWTEYPENDPNANFYGSTMEELEYKLSKGHAYVICDNHGFKQFKEVYDNVVSIFLYADIHECANNMSDRGDNVGNISSRLLNYHREVANKGKFDYVVKNIRGSITLTKTTLASIIYSEMLKAGRNDSK